MIRGEVECVVSGEMGAHLLEGASSRLVKTRYGIPLTGSPYTVEVDVFTGELAGLVLMEIEFQTKRAADTFKLPPDLRGLVVREVTGDSRYDNVNLARTQKIPDATAE